MNRFTPVFLCLLLQAFGSIDLISSYTEQELVMQRSSQPAGSGRDRLYAREGGGFLGQQRAGPPWAKWDSRCAGDHALHPLVRGVPLLQEFNVRFSFL